MRPIRIIRRETGFEVVASRRTHQVNLSLNSGDALRVSGLHFGVKTMGEDAAIHLAGVKNQSSARTARAMSIPTTGKKRRRTAIFTCKLLFIA